MFRLNPILSFFSLINALTTLAASLAEKSLSSESNINDIISQANNTVATTLGISAENIGQDYLKVKNPKSLAAAAQVSSILSVVGSAAGQGDSNAAIDGFATMLSQSSDTVDLTNSNSVLSIIQSTAENTGAT